MKVLQILILIFVFNFLANAQADCGYSFRLSVSNENGETINNADVEFQNSKLKYNTDAKVYYFSDFGGCGLKNGLLKVNADGFDKFETEIGFRGYAAFELNLKIKESKNTSVFKELGVLFGDVKKGNGKVIPKAKVTLVDERGKIFETFSNKDGKFYFIVDSGIYKLEINGVAGFVPKTIEKLKLSPKRYNDLDIVLEVRNRKSDKNKKTGN